MRKTILILAVVVVAAVGALLWYVGARAEEPDQISVPPGHISVSMGTIIDWTIPTDPDCNKSLFTSYYPQAMDEPLWIFEDENHGLMVDKSRDRVHGKIVEGAYYSKRMPLHIYIYAISEVRNGGSLLCSNVRWWQINVTVPDSSRFGHKINTHVPLPARTATPSPTATPNPLSEPTAVPSPTAIPIPTPTLMPEPCGSYYHDHEGGLGSWGSTNCINDLDADYFGVTGKKTSIETDYHWHENDNDNGGVPHSGGVSHNSP